MEGGVHVEEGRGGMGMLAKDRWSLSGVVPPHHLSSLLPSGSYILPPVTFPESYLIRFFSSSLPRTSSSPPDLLFFSQCHICILPLFKIHLCISCRRNQLEHIKQCFVCVCVFATVTLCPNDVAKGDLGFVRSKGTRL